MAKPSVRFAIVGGGLMGREFASAAARWLHLINDVPRPEIVAVADPSESVRAWWAGHGFATFPDYGTLTQAVEHDAAYVAVPHHLHEATYTEVLRAGKHLFAEKPFGIDRAAAERIAAEITPSTIVRVSSEFPFFPPVQRIVRLHNEGFFGRVFEIRTAFRHASDYDPTKPMNWKRRVATCGEYGCLGDLGLHVVHLPFRLGHRPKDVRALLSRVVTHRPDGHGNLAECETWENGTLLCRGENGELILLETKRVAPGETNSWEFAIYGTDGCAEFTSKRPKTLRTLRREGGRQGWMEEDVAWGGAVHPGITGGIFEFGFPDAIQQMWAAYLTELGGESPPFPCASVDEVLFSHRLFTAALRSQESGQAEAV